VVFSVSTPSLFFMQPFIDALHANILAAALLTRDIPAQVTGMHAACRLATDAAKSRNVHS
jgi:hypothetical protein